MLPSSSSLRYRGRRNSASPSLSVSVDPAMTTTAQLHDDDRTRNIPDVRAQSLGLSPSHLPSPVSSSSIQGFEWHSEHSEHGQEHGEGHDSGDSVSSANTTRKASLHTTEVEHPISCHKRHAGYDGARRGSIPRRNRNSVTNSQADGDPSYSSLNRHDDNALDIPLAVAIIPPLGTLLIGGNFILDFVLLLLMFFYLHQLIKLPWELYLASRPRRTTRKRVAPQASDFTHDTDIPPHLHNLYTLAESELKSAEFIFLGLSVLSPLVGAALLRYVCTSLTGRDYISWFSTGVFVLVAGIRPWGHLTRRLRERTEELQEAVERIQEYAISKEDEEEDNMLRRIEALEDVVARSREKLEGLEHEMDVSLNPTLEKLASDVQHQVWVINERLGMLESAVKDALVDDKEVGNKKIINNWFAPTRPQPVNLPPKSGFDGHDPSSIRSLERSSSIIKESTTYGTRRRSKSWLLPSSFKTRRRSGSLSTTIPTTSKPPARSRILQNYDKYLMPIFKFGFEFVMEATLGSVASCLRTGRRWVQAFGLFVKRSFV